MALYFAIRTKATRPEMRTEGLNERERASYVRHVAWLQRKVDEGAMIFVGRTASIATTSWALGVIKADTKEAAQAIMNEDPFVEDGVAIPELFDFEIIRVEPQNL